MMLSGHDLHKSFGHTPALRGANVEVGRGEIVAVMGPSGSGKSTLLHCLAGILRPDQGEVRFLDRRIDALPDRERSRLRLVDFGFVFQFGQLVPELPIVENVALPLVLTGQRQRAAVIQATGWLDRLGLDGLGGQLPGDLSAGQGQRAAVARALITGPKVIFADEPTGALDSASADQVMQLLVDAARERDASVLLVTHDHRVAGFSDRTVLVRDGSDTLLPAGPTRWGSP